MGKDLHDIIRHMQRVGDEMERMCEGFFSPHTMGVLPDRCYRPPTDVYETEDALVVKMAISGLDTEQTEILAQGDKMLIRGHRRESCPHHKVAFHQMEIHYGYFERLIRIPHHYKPDSIKASYEGGFLEIVVPKAARPSARPLKVNITSEKPKGTG